MFFIKTGEGSFWSRPVKRALSRALERYDGPPFELRLWDGQRVSIGAGAPGFSVTFKTRQAFCDTLLRRSLGLGEAYVRHEVLFDVDLEEALPALGAIALRVSTRLGWPDAPCLGEVLLDRLGLPALAPSAQHYGRGDDFYRLYLDKRLQYSCGYFRAPGDSLDTAQAQKIAVVARKLALRRGQRLLDLGCGWGHLLLHAAETYGVQCLGITLCDSQARYIREQAAARRLPVEVRVMSFEDLDEHASWDRIVSIDSICHVGERRVGSFFDKVKALLAPGSLCLLQSIARTRESPRTDPFLRKHVFPGYWVPSLEGMMARASARGLDVLDVENLRRHHELTARCWRRNFLQNRDRIERTMGFDDAFMRTWDFYLAYAVAAFRTGHLSVVQAVMSNGLQHDYPLTREPLYVTDEPVLRERAAAWAAAPGVATA
jgi:cyclopropane-fatty-acyl-phospholipid synthase